MNIIVTGSAGYIGSITSELLLAKGAKVVVIDNMQEGHIEAVPRGAVFCKGDFSDAD